MFERTNYYEDLCHFLEDKKTAEHFGMDFKKVLTETHEQSASEAIQLLRGWAPHVPIIEIRPMLEKYFKEH